MSSLGDYSFLANDSGAKAFSSLDPNDSNLSDQETPDPSDVNNAYFAGTQGGGSYGQTPFVDPTTTNDVVAGLGELITHPIKFLEDAFNLNTSSTSILPVPST